jgi:SOS-response transcriptional repressor LexA
MPLDPTEFSQRLEAARHAKCLSKAQVCTALGLPGQRYITFLHGSGRKHVPKLAALLGVRVEWLTTGAYPPEWYKHRPDAARFTTVGSHLLAGTPAIADVNATEQAPVVRDDNAAEPRDAYIEIIGEVTAGSGWAEPSQDPDDWKPIAIRSHWRAVRIQGDSGHPVVWDGQTVIVDDRLPLKHNRLVVVQTDDRRAYLKRYCVSAEVPSGFVLASVNIGRDSFALSPHAAVRMAVVVGTLFTDSVVH